MKKFQQSKVAIKIALPIMLGSILFLDACSDSEKYQYKDMKDTESKPLSYYQQNLEEAFEKAKWCYAKDMIGTPEFDTIDRLNKVNCMNAKEAFGGYSNKEELKKDKEKYKLYEQYEDFIEYKLKQYYKKAG